jgi:hemoglobin
MNHSKVSLYEQLGGRPTLERVHKLFYDKLYAHPWLGQFFVEVPRTVIEPQQTDFMGQTMGGPATYCGKFPIPAHKHMFITEELFDLRHKLLGDSLKEAGVPQLLADGWLAVDAAFKARLCKKSPSECEGRFKMEPIVVIPRVA